LAAAQRLLSVVPMLLRGVRFSFMVVGVFCFTLSSFPYAQGIQTLTSDIEQQPTDFGFFADSPFHPVAVSEPKDRLNERLPILSPRKSAVD
jgi:hypothetical protein